MTDVQRPGETSEQLLLTEAAELLMRLQSGDAPDDVINELEQWRALTPRHAAVWQRAETVLVQFECVPTAIAKPTLQELKDPGRRRALHTLAVIALAPPAVWLTVQHQPWQAWRADLATATGEQRRQVLTDGSELLLNTNTAVGLRFEADMRQIAVRRGELLVSPGPGSVEVPHLSVRTAEGVVQAARGQIHVRQLKGKTRVGVLEGHAMIRTLASSVRTLQAGESTEFSPTLISPPSPLQRHALLWQQGTLLAQHMPLADFLGELARYRVGVLRAHPSVASLPVSGAFSLIDTDASLQLLARTRPLVIRQLTRYWVSVEAAA